MIREKLNSFLSQSQLKIAKEAMERAKAEAEAAAAGEEGEAE
jgi:hypothetical protein